MFTSNYAALSKIEAPLKPVSISRGKPRWLKGGWLKHVRPGTIGRNYDALAPSYASLKATDAEYDRAFNAILRGLDPRAVYDELGGDAVLLCFCPVGQFCHRRIVAEWLEYHLGIVVPELGFPRDQTEVHAGKRYDFYVPPKKKLAWIEAQLAKAK